MRFVAYRAELANRDVLSVDGVSPLGPNLSHWPGNRTPAAYRATTSTGMVLRARRDPEGWKALEREIVTNTHYDTDGVLSVALALRPELMAREAAWLAAATAGDLERWVSREAAILDRCLAGLNEHTASPLLPQVRALPREERLAAVYAHALDHLEEIVAHPERLEDLWRDEVEQMERDRARLGAATIEMRPAIDLATIVSAQRLHRAAIRHAVAPLGRQLECWGGSEAAFTYAIDTWFDAPGLSRSPRHPLSLIEGRWKELDPGVALSASGAIDSLWPELHGRTALAPDRLAAMIATVLAESDAQVAAAQPSVG